MMKLENLILGDLIFSRIFVYYVAFENVTNRQPPQSKQMNVFKNALEHNP